MKLLWNLFWILDQNRAATKEDDNPANSVRCCHGFSGRSSGPIFGSGKIKMWRSSHTRTEDNNLFYLWSECSPAQQIQAGEEQPDKQGKHIQQPSKARNGQLLSQLGAKTGTTMEEIPPKRSELAKISWAWSRTSPSHVPDKKKNVLRTCAASQQLCSGSSLRSFCRKKSPKEDSSRWNRFHLLKSVFKHKHTTHLSVVFFHQEQQQL